MNQIIIEEIRSLIDYLNAKTAEYDNGNPTISDAEWDAKYFRLTLLEREYSIYFNDSPTQTISYQVVNQLDKIEHNHDMLSLEKTKSLDEVEAFLGKQGYIAMAKMDGLTCSLRYEDGILVSAETRGDGKIGENILHNAKIIPSIPSQIPYKETLIVDGEIICSKLDFKEFEKEYKNPRNFAAGSIRLLDAKECSKRKLQFIAWEVIEGFEDEKFLTSKLDRLGKCGFLLVPYISNPGKDTGLNFISNEEIIQTLTKEIEEYSYPIDGIVFKFNNVEYGLSLGKTSHHFKNAIAYKFYDEAYPTELLDIEWGLGRTGVLTPVAIFNPIDIDGSTVERASLHNISVMEELSGGFERKGDILHIIKSNQIIPQVNKWEHIGEYNEENHFNIPEVCPVCGEKTEIHISETGVKELYCSNQSCDGKLINKLDHFCGKSGLDIKGLSKATLEKLIEWGWVSNSVDLFELKNYRSEWIRKPGFGIRSVDKVLEAIENAKDCELNAFISSLGIPLIGVSVSKEIVKTFPNWNDFINAIESGYHFWDISGFGYEMHMAITKFDYTEAKTLYENYLRVSAVSNTNEKTNTNLNDLSFVITGKVNHFKNRDELKSLIEANGGKVAGSISGKTSYLINNDVESTSSKNISAKKLGIPIISEENFIAMFGIQ